MDTEGDSAQQVIGELRSQLNRVQEDYFKARDDLRVADSRVSSLNQQLLDSINEKTKVEGRIKELELAVKGFEAWQKARKSLEAYEVGGEVLLGPPENDVHGIVERVVVDSSGVHYDVCWWGGQLSNRLLRARMPANQVRPAADVLLPSSEKSADER